MTENKPTNAGAPKPVACVTGASGMIGKRIVKLLLEQGIETRVLTRRPETVVPNVTPFIGGLENEEVLRPFLDKAQFLFHCAAELTNQETMWDVNVEGTKRLLRLAREQSLTYFCHLSSVGVIGKTEVRLIDESTPCNPQNSYERSKLAAEELVLEEAIAGCSVVALRPTNVVDHQKMGVLKNLFSQSLSSRLKRFLKGAEHAHLIHADDVAAAAVHFLGSDFDAPQVFIVSNDHESNGTYKQLWKLSRSMRNLNSNWVEGLSLPWQIPYALRRLRGRSPNRGDVHYSSKKLLESEFEFQLGIEGAIGEVLQLRKESVK